ncbi:hypothetical protein PYCCODRAFT_123709 [Trametes coccinea BRFM310]|uniref:Uncharacterized protein n=1 Tax=Trametes coccinea (strain BRFM310) TaxID=1353009 RepID=A0A1Y2I566_TRAC3|nr:hypothetical protein PYCCODRAFT_123709 [Trametes coccinea BRFM310]
MQMVHPGPCERDRSSLIAPAGSVCSNQTEGGAKIVDSDSTVEPQADASRWLCALHTFAANRRLSLSLRPPPPPTIVLLEPRTLRLATPAISLAACAGHHNKSRQVSTLAYRHALASKAFRGGSQSSGDRSSSNVPRLLCQLRNPLTQCPDLRAVVLQRQQCPLEGIPVSSSHRRYQFSPMRSAAAAAGQGIPHNSRCRLPASDVSDTPMPANDSHDGIGSACTRSSRPKRQISRRGRRTLKSLRGGRAVVNLRDAAKSISAIPDFRSSRATTRCRQRSHVASSDHTALNCTHLSATNPCLVGLGVALMT